MMEIQVEIFGLLHRPDALQGARKGRLTVPDGATIEDMLGILSIGRGANLIFLVNGQQEIPEYRLKENDLVKVLLPISGG
jgi:sulfur carrier protein ThiS